MLLRKGQGFMTCKSLTAACLPGDWQCIRMMMTIAHTFWQKDLASAGAIGPVSSVGTIHE